MECLSLFRIDTQQEILSLLSQACALILQATAFLYRLTLPFHQHGIRRQQPHLSRLFLAVHQASAAAGLARLGLPCPSQLNLRLHSQPMTQRISLPLSRP